MEVDRKSSKGGFLSLFDWGGKSRKKLFPNNNPGELDGIRKVKENVDEYAPRFRLVEYDESRGLLNNKGNGESNCASSIGSDDGYRTGAPSVVARLMGLDTMPSVNVNDLYSAQNMDSRSLRNGCIPGNMFEGLYMNDQNFSYNQNGFLRAPAVMTPQKMPGRLIERFQTETLPPRSSKTIPITHHKLLSPIKSPRFVPTKNAAYIMEAASRIIDPNPRTAVNSRMASSHASSFVPLRIRDLKERMEASQQKSLRLQSQKPRENPMRNNFNRKEVTTVNGIVDVSRMKAPLNTASRSESSKSIGKAGSRTEVVKSYRQSREGSISSSIKISSQRVASEVVSKPAVRRSQQGIRRNEQPRAAAVRTSSVIRQNNQKQIDTRSGNNSGSGSSIPNQLKKKSTPTNGSLRTKKVAQKIVSLDQSKSRKEITNTDTGKQYPVSKGIKAQPQNKLKNGSKYSINLMPETGLRSKDGKSIQCNAVIGDNSSWATGNNKDGMDVISFTFSSPIKKYASNFEDIGQVMENGQPTGECSHNVKTSTLSPQRLNRIGPDSLGILLEQKLKELTCNIDSSSGTFNESHETRFQDSVPSSNVTKTSSEEYNNTSRFCIASENSDSVSQQESNSYDLFPGRNRRAQDIEDCCSVSKKNDSNRKLDAGLNTVSYAEDSPLNEGWCSSSENSCSLQDIAMFEITDASESCTLPECEVESMESPNRKLAISYSYLFDPPPTRWESQYVRDVISHAELSVNSYLLGQVDNVIKSSLFDQLDNEPSLSESKTYLENSNKLERRLLFDCTSELLNQRCQQLTTRCCKSWSEWAASPFQTESLSRELYREISCLKNMEELMVDEVVDKDMSSGKGRWVNFDLEALEECIEMEELILSSLMDEAVDLFI